MGEVIKAYTSIILRLVNRSPVLKGAGVLLGLGLVSGVGYGSWFMIVQFNRISVIAATMVEIVLLASCLAGRSLRHAAEDVLAPLIHGDLTAARLKLSLYVGRNTEQLTETEVLRAILETVSENATDGVTAPLFYSILGALLGVGSVPLALAYKAASTLDSMVGYREPPYTHLGWFSARLEDGLTWVPCRLTVLSVALLSGSPVRVWRTCQRDAIADPSPNAGWSECAYAAALEVQLGGTNFYRGVLKEKPLLGDPIRPITPEVIRKALRFNRYIVLLWLGITIVIHRFYSVMLVNWAQ